MYAWIAAAARDESFVGLLELDSVLVEQAVKIVDDLRHLKPLDMRRIVTEGLVPAVGHRSRILASHLALWAPRPDPITPCSPPAPPPPAAAPPAVDMTARTCLARAVKKCYTLDTGGVSSKWPIIAGEVTLGDLRHVVIKLSKSEGDVQREYAIFMKLAELAKGGATGCVTAYDCPDPEYIVLELFGRDIVNLLHPHNGDVRYALCREIAAALHALHKLGFTHGDLKPQNILHMSVDGKRTVKLCDLECARSVRDGGGAICTRWQRRVDTHCLLCTTRGD